MLLEVKEAEYVGGYRVRLRFNDGYEGIAYLGLFLARERRSIFEPLKDKDYFRRFRVHLNTISWDNEADFAPEFLRELAVSSEDAVAVAEERGKYGTKPNVE